MGIYLENGVELESVTDNFIGGICLFNILNDTDFEPVYFNDGFLRMLGYERSEAEGLIHNFRYSIIPEDIQILRQGFEDILKDDGSVDIEFRTVTKTGGLRWLHVTGNLYNRHDKVNTAVCIVIDCTERKAIEAENASEYERLNIITESDNAFVTDYNAKTDVIMIRPNGGSKFRKNIFIKDYIGSGINRIIHENDRENVVNIYKDAMKSPHKDILEFRSDFINPGEYRWYKESITSVMGQEGYVTRIIGRLNDIDSEKCKQQELELRADIDSLTQVFNKGAAVTLIKNSYKSISEDQYFCALLMMDVDNFKNVNDTLGHAKGDEVLAFIGMQLFNIFKGKDIVGRFGGDEFIIFIQDLRSKSDSEKMAENIMNAVRKTFISGNARVDISCSIGIAISRYGEYEYDQLFEMADKALYEIKRNGKNSFRTYDKEMK